MERVLEGVVSKISPMIERYGKTFEIALTVKLDVIRLRLLTDAYKISHNGAMLGG